MEAVFFCLLHNEGGEDKTKKGKETEPSVLYLEGAGLAGLKKTPLFMFIFRFFFAFSVFFIIY